MTTQAATAPRPLGTTSRRDRWWAQPAAIGTALTIFGIYTIVIALMNKDYLYTKNGASLLTPFYSPNLKSLFGLNISFTYAFFVLWVPLGLRGTCYYYRKSYYRAFFLAPPSCAVAGLQRKKYSGETKFPLIFQNLHRFFWGLAFIVQIFLAYDVVRAFLYTPTPGDWRFGISLGALIMLVNWFCLAFFTFGCNSFRHVIGGKLDCFDCSGSARTRHGIWAKFVTPLNHKHQFWAWVSMFTVWGTDLYIRLASAGAFNDPHHIF